MRGNVLKNLPLILLVLAAAVPSVYADKAEQLQLETGKDLMFRIPGRENPLTGAFPPAKQSAAYHNYLKRPRSEYSKLLYLMDRLKTTDFKVVCKGHEYELFKLKPLVCHYIALNYKNEKAEDWIVKHAYRTQQGSLLYLKSDDGKTRILKDVLLEELRFLPPD